MSLGDFTNPLMFDSQEQAERIRMVVWMLKHFLLQQLRTHIYLLVEPTAASLLSPSNVAVPMAIRRRESLGNERQTTSLTSDGKIVILIY